MSSKDISDQQNDQRMGSGITLCLVRTAVLSQFFIFGLKWLMYILLQSTYKILLKSSQPIQKEHDLFLLINHYLSGMVPNQRVSSNLKSKKDSCVIIFRNNFSLFYCQMLTGLNIHLSPSYSVAILESMT